MSEGEIANNPQQQPEGQPKNEIAHEVAEEQHQVAPNNNEEAQDAPFEAPLAPSAPISAVPDPIPQPREAIEQIPIEEVAASPVVKPIEVEPEIPDFPAAKINHMESIDGIAIEPAVNPPAPADQPRPYTLDDRLRDANILKTRGNELYKTKNYEEAIKAYTESLSIAHPDLFNNSSQELMYKMAELNVALLQNLAASYFAIGQFETAEKVATQVLMINPKHFKALYRRALCLFELNRLEEAYQCIKDAYSIDGSVGQVNEAYRKIHTAYKQEKEAKKKLYKSMFGGKEEAARSELSESLVPAEIEQEEPAREGSGWGIVAAGAAVAALCVAGTFLFRHFRR